MSKHVLTVALAICLLWVVQAARAEVFGADDRKDSRAVEAQLSRFKPRVGQLRTLDQSDENGLRLSTCTGSLIQQNYLITAAHCAYGPDGKLMSNQFFYPDSTRRRNSPYRGYRVERVFHPKSFVPGKVTPWNDIAVMELAPSQVTGKNAGQIAGHFGIWGTEAFPTSSALIFGYPGDKGGDQVYQKGCDVRVDPGRREVLISDCDVGPGQSGSATLFYSEAYGSYYVHGVMNSEGPYGNFGARLTPERDDIVRQIITGAVLSDKDLDTEGREPWVARHAPAPHLVSVNVRNACDSEDLYISREFKDLKNRWRADGFSRVGPLSEQLMFESANTVFFLGAYRKNGTRLSRNDVALRLKRSGQQTFLQRYSVSDWGSFTIEFGC